MPCITIISTTNRFHLQQLVDHKKYGKIFVDRYFIIMIFIVIKFIAYNNSQRSISHIHLFKHIKLILITTQTIVIDTYTSPSAGELFILIS